MAPARLRELFLSDPYLAVDEADNLLFIDEFTPDEAAGAAGTAEATALALQPLTDTFRLHSLPGVTKVIYLDFDGHTTSGTAWSGGATIVSAALHHRRRLPPSARPNSSASSTSGSASPRTSSRTASTSRRRTRAWRRCGNSGTGDIEWGQRVVVSPTNWYNTGAGGVAYIGSFSWNSDTPCFVFSAQLGTGHEKYTAEAIAHEAGHTSASTTTASPAAARTTRATAAGRRSWASATTRPLSQWSRGEYAERQQCGRRPRDHDRLRRAPSAPTTTGTQRPAQRRSSWRTPRTSEAEASSSVRPTRTPSPS